MLGLLDAACALIELSLSKETEPHPSNAVDFWESFDKHLHPDDARQISQSGNRIYCCFDAIFTTIHRGQTLGVYSSELASGMYGLASNMFGNYKFCEMIVNQPSPAPFAASWCQDCVVQNGKPTYIHQVTGGELAWQPGTSWLLSCCCCTVGRGTHANSSAGILHELSICHHWKGASFGLDVDAGILEL